MKKIRKDITGQRFGRLTVLGVGSREIGRIMWRCRCDCGTEKEIEGTKLRTGHTQSCGCFHREQVVKAMTKHGHGGTNKERKKSPEYSTYFNVLNRCHNQNDDNYPSYGGRGIFVCDKWRGENGFIAFFEDMGKKPPGDYSLGRRDNDGPYDPKNCRWETRIQQGGNTRRTIMMTFMGKTQCKAAWSRELGISTACIDYRLKKGMSHEEALSTPQLKRAPVGHGIKPQPTGCANQEMIAWIIPGVNFFG